MEKEIADATSSFSSLDTKLVFIEGLIKKMHNYLLESRSAAIPPLIYEGVSQINSAVAQIRKKINGLEDERQSLRALAQIGQVVNSSIELEVVLQTVMDTIIRLTGAERGFLMLKNKMGDFEITIARNWVQETLEPSEFVVSRTIINRVASTRLGVLTTNAQEDPRFTGQQSVIAYNLRSILCVPLSVKGELTGVIYADNRIRSGLFTQKQLDLLSDFANSAAVAIENARLFESIRHALAEVTELKNFIENVFTSIASGVLTADESNHILMCNPAAGMILGRDSKEIIGQNLQDVLTVHVPLLEPYLWKVLRTDQQVLGLETNSILPPRGQVDLRFSLSALKDVHNTSQGVAIVMEDLTERKRLEGQQRLFERMVSPAVIEQLDPDSIQFGGEKAEITILFADIRGFTSFSETVDPVALVSVLNRYLGAAAEAVLREEGTIDKFLGDAVMAWFNAPIPQPDHTLRAVRAALLIKSAVEGLHKEMEPTGRLSFGVGIHVGEAVLGLVGTEKRLDYTAIGDSVNTAKRIQENTGSGQILISQSAYERVSKYVRVKPVEPIIAKGKKDPLEVFEVEGLIIKK